MKYYIKQSTYAPDIIQVWLKAPLMKKVDKKIIKNISDKYILCRYTHSSCILLPSKKLYELLSIFESMELIYDEFENSVDEEKIFEDEETFVDRGN